MEADDLSNGSLAFRISAVAWFSFCILFVAASYKAFVPYSKQKPLGLQTMMDFVHRDMAYAYAMCFGNGAIVSLIPVINRRPINDFIAFPLAWYHMARIFMFLAYLPFTSIMRYIHIFHSQLLENLEIGDEEFLKRCYYTIFGSSLMASTIVLVIHSGNA